MQIPITSGIFTDNNSDLRTSYPINYVVVPKSSGLSTEYLKPFYGIVEFAQVDGVDRGGINWNGYLYRVVGSKLIKIFENGNTQIIGDVGNDNKFVRFDYSFDYLSIASNKKLYLYSVATGLDQVTDVDLGNVLDQIFVDGYFMTTDGEFLIVTELNDPFTVLTTKYGSSEVNPDPIKAIIKVRNEPIAVNRYTMETFRNIGGSVFPFQRVDGALLNKGAVGTRMCCNFIDSVAFVGGGVNESLGIYIGANAQFTKISTREIDTILQNYTELELSLGLIETIVDRSNQYLIVHLPDLALVYDYAASKEIGSQIWSILTSSIVNFSQYRGVNFIYCYDSWHCGDRNGNKLGVLSNDVSSHFGDQVRWEFGTQIFYNNGSGAIFYELELVSLSGRCALGIDDTLSTSYSVDGVNWSQDKTIKAGKQGNRTRRLNWLNQGSMNNFRIQRFRGTSRSRLSFIRLEARLEPLFV